jgi:hypothetical protein
MLVGFLDKEKPGKGRLVEPADKLNVIVHGLSWFNGYRILLFNLEVM